MSDFKTLAALAAVVLAAVLAGCGDDGDSGSTGSSVRTGSSGSSGGYGDTGSTATNASRYGSAGGEAGVATVTVASVPELGQVIVDGDGFTLYNFHKDKGTKSSCYGDCEQAWPPLLTGSEPQAGGGAVAAKLGTSKRRDGSEQVTYAGHPLYTFVKDVKPGDAKGNDVDAFGAEWYALEPSGSEPED